LHFESYGIYFEIKLRWRLWLKTEMSVHWGIGERLRGPSFACWADRCLEKAFQREVLKAVAVKLLGQRESATGLEDDPTG
jgi:hypothetical protein